MATGIGGNNVPRSVQLVVRGQIASFAAPGAIFTHAPHHGAWATRSSGGIAAHGHSARGAAGFGAFAGPLFFQRFSSKQFRGHGPVRIERKLQPLHHADRAGSRCKHLNQVKGFFEINGPGIKILGKRRALAVGNHLAVQFYLGGSAKSILIKNELYLNPGSGIGQGLGSLLKVDVLDPASLADLAPTIFKN